MSNLILKEDRIGIANLNGTTITIKGDRTVHKAIQGIAQYGLITFSKEQVFKSSTFYICFFKPVKKLRQLYGLGNEILIVCCKNSMQDFSSRTKDFIDYILVTSGEFKNRLDRVMCIVVDKCENIVDIIKQDRVQHPESRLIVPFSYGEFNHNLTEEVLQDRLRTFLYERDLFSIASPLNDEALFFGKKRFDQIQLFNSRYIEGEPSGLFGLRRIGKTSVLNLLRQRIESAHGAAIYFDCSQYHNLRWNEFLQQIIKETKEKFQSDDDYNGCKLPNSFTLNEFNNELRYSEGYAKKNFEDDIISIYRALGNTRILLIFDEIESIGFDTSPSDHWKKGTDALNFWQAIRSIIQKNRSFLSFIISGVNPHCIEISHISGIDNPIFSCLSPSYISLFDYSDTKEMVNTIGKHLGLEFEEEIISRLTDDFGGHPFLTRQICSHINTRIIEERIERPYKISRYRYDSEKNNFDLIVAPIIEQILLILKTQYTNEYTLLKKLAIEGKRSFRKELGGGEKAIAHLLGYCLIEKEGDDYYVRIKSIERYLQNKYQNEAPWESQDHKIQQISIRRGRIECRLRELLKGYLVQTYGRKAKDQLIELIKQNSADSKQIDRMNKSLSLDKCLEELYFLQLSTIISKKYKHFSNIIPDKNKYDMCTKIINDFRIDAHAKSINEEDEEYLRIALNNLEKMITF